MIGLDSIGQSIICKSESTRLTKRIQQAIELTQIRQQLLAFEIEHELEHRTSVLYHKHHDFHN